MNNSVVKLSKFCDVAKIDLHADLIVEALDQFFVLSKKTANGFKLLFRQYEIQSQYDFYQPKILVSLIKSIKDNLSKKSVSKTDMVVFYLNDINWLTQYFVEHLQKIDPTKQYNLNSIKEFIKTSPAVKQAKKEFEKNVVKFLINVNMKKGYVPKKRKRSRHIFYFEENFRDEILCCADALGFDRHHAELTLEVNSQLWRKQNMVRSFMTHYYPSVDQPSDNELYLNWYHLAKKHRNKWLKCREFEYYHDHRTILDEAGTITENMQIGQIRYALFTQKLKEYESRRVRILQKNQQKEVEQIVNL